MTLEAKNGRPTPLRHGDFKPKMTPSSDCFGPISHLTCPLSPKARYLTCPLGLMDPYEPYQPQITATWVTLEANNPQLNTLRHKDF